MPDTRRKSIGGTSRGQAGAIGWFGVIFGIPFLGAGVVMSLVAAGIFPVSGKPPPVLIMGSMGAVFGLAGLLVMVQGARGVFRKRRIDGLKRMRPAQAWFWDHAWEGRKVVDGKLGSVIAGWAGTAFFCLFLTPFNYVVFFHVKDEVPFFAKGVIGLFDLIGVIVIGTAIYKTLQYLKYGSSVLHFDRFPFHPGEQMAARLEAPAQLGSFNALELTLRHIEERIEVHGSGKNRSQRSVRYQVYADTTVYQKGALAGGGGRELRVTFDLPAQPYLTRLSENPPRYWELEVKGDAPGVDYHALFLIPVYAK